ncbi:unnamed protein product [Brassica rapa subsp. trilocularis]
MYQTNTGGSTTRSSRSLQMEPLQLVASEGTPSRRGAVQPEPVEAGGGVRA